MSMFFQIPGSGDLYSYYVDFDTRRLEPWEKIIPSFKYSTEVNIVWTRHELSLYCLVTKNEPKCVEIVNSR